MTPAVRRAALLPLAAAALAASCPAPLAIFDGFDGGAIDDRRWKPIGLADRDRIVPAPPGRSTRAAQVWVEPGDVEPPAAGRFAEEIRLDCSVEPPAVVQRSERRLLDQPAFGAGSWYGFSFRMDDGIPATGSTRWVIAQWKQTESCWSPFLAQRFDNGVFHVTVEDNDCRATIASARGDPDARLRAAPRPGPRTPPAAEASEFLTGFVVEGQPGAGTPCTARIRREPREPPELPSPARRWVSMAYFVKGGPDGTGRVEVYADGARVVVATGHIGDSRAGAREYFKFGMYRDEIALRSSMLFDDFRRGPSRDAVDPALCGE